MKNIGIEKIHFPRRFYAIGSIADTFNCNGVELAVLDPDSIPDPDKLDPGYACQGDKHHEDQNDEFSFIHEANLTYHPGIHTGFNFSLTLINLTLTDLNNNSPWLLS